MNDELDDDELARMQRLGDAATMGPWKSFIEGRDHEAGSNFAQTDGHDIEMSGAATADYDFIAIATQDVPRLIAEVRRLRARETAPKSSREVDPEIVASTNIELARFVGGNARLWNFAPTHDHLAVMLRTPQGVEAYLVLSGCERIQLPTGWRITAPSILQPDALYYELVDEGVRVRCRDAGIFAEYKRW